MSTPPDPDHAPESGASLSAKERYRLKLRYRAALVRVLEMQGYVDKAGLQLDHATILLAECVRHVLDQTTSAAAVFGLDETELNIVSILADRHIEARQKATISRYLRARAAHFRRHPAKPIHDKTPPTERERNDVRGYAKGFRTSHPGEDIGRWLGFMAENGIGAREWWFEVWKEIEAEEKGAGK